MTASGEKFKHGNAKLARMLTDPQTRREVDEGLAAMDQEDNEYRRGRRAAATDSPKS